MDRRSLMLMIAATMVVVGACKNNPGNSGNSTSAGTTDLEIEIIGGFAYVPTPSDNMLEIAFLKDWKFTGADDADPATPATQVFCDVKQLGTELMVETGSITTLVPAQQVPGSNKFNIKGAVITFPALETAGLSLSAPHPPRNVTPFSPSDPENDSHWEDLRYVPSLKGEHAGTTIVPDWRGRVDGLMRLKGGTVKAKKPSLVKLKKAKFDFKKGGATSQFVQSMSDRTIYKVTVPSGVVELALTTPALTKIVITPQGGKVKLKLMGVHNNSAAPMPGDEIKDHCTFYQLLQPRPEPPDWLRPHYIPAVVASTQNQNPQPTGMTPGFFCPGDWF